MSSFKELRELTPKEIENILDFIKPNKSIPKEASLAIVKNMKQRFRSQLVGQKVYPEVIPQLKILLEKNYKESLIQAGESVGIIAAQSIGEKNTQSSVDYNEYILIKIGDDVRKIKIGEFIDDYLEKFGKVTLTNGSEVQICNNVYILTVSQEEKIEWKEVNEVSRHPPHGDLVKLTTESGRNIITTFSHSHLKKQARNIVPVLGSSLKVGDQIPVIKNTPNPKSEGMRNFDISEYMTGRVGPKEYDTDSDNENEENDNYFFAYKQRIKRYIQNDELFAWFIGIFLTYGRFTDYGVTITSSDNSSEFKNNLDRFCNEYDIHKDDNSNYLFSIFGMKPYNYVYNLNSKILRTFLIKICGYDYKKIPDFLFRSNKNVIKSFLYTYLSQIKFKKDNIDILRDISFLLTYFGIYSCIDSEKLFIHPNSLTEFSTQFGFDVSVINLKNFTNDIYNKSDAEFLKNIDRNSKRNIPMSDLKYYEQIIKSDVAWEKIVKLELVTETTYIDNYGKHVYDFSVTGNETFALLSGIVVHNTLNTLKKGKLYQKYS